MGAGYNDDVVVSYHERDFIRKALDGRPPRVLIFNLITERTIENATQREVHFFQKCCTQTW